MTNHTENAAFYLQDVSKKATRKKIETYSKIEPYLCSFDISHYWN